MAIVDSAWARKALDIHSEQASGFVWTQTADGDQDPPYEVSGHVGVADELCQQPSSERFGGI